ncbi:MAG: flagellar hook-basal body complex protein FliE [Bacteriovoracaceae bacterium]|nr:flagellar hook-basal body complex protein FliE [Bacteriovoracaceae bacterium]
MSILNVGQMSSTLGTGKIKEWANSQNQSLELGNINPPLGAGDQTAATPQSFASFLKTSLSDVNQIQSSANESIQRLVSGEEQDIHETMLLVEKAELAFKTMGQIRSKVIEAYREIMRMQI